MVDDDDDGAWVKFKNCPVGALKYFSPFIGGSTSSCH